MYKAIGKFHWPSPLLRPQHIRQAMPTEASLAQPTKNKTFFSNFDANGGWGKSENTAQDWIKSGSSLSQKWQRARPRKPQATHAERATLQKNTSLAGTLGN